MYNGYVEMINNNKEGGKMTKFASVKKLIDLKRKQRHIIRSFRQYDNINSYAFDLWIASVQVNKHKKKLRRKQGEVA